MSCRSNTGAHIHTQSDAIYGNGSDLEICGARKNQKRTDAQSTSLFIQTITFNHWRAHAHTHTFTRPCSQHSPLNRYKEQRLCKSMRGGDEPISVLSCLIVFRSFLLISIYFHYRQTPGHSSVPNRTFKRHRISICICIIKGGS